MTVAAPPAHEFAAAWDAFTRASRRARSRGGTIEGSGLTLAQFQLLEGLQTSRAMTVSELAQAAGVAPPTATRMLDALVRGGLAERTPSAADRRVVHVSLTRAGHAAVRAAAAQVAAARAAVRDSLTADEQAQAAVLLHKLAEAIDAL
jgi:MarR family transcriptional regulator, organic hydroperoxide resistance regulator